MAAKKIIRELKPLRPQVIDLTKQSERARSVAPLPKFGESGKVVVAEMKRISAQDIYTTVE